MLSFLIREVSILKCSPLLNHLCVNAHILKHLLMFGIGLRQICDSARICKAYYGRVDGQKLQKAYKKVGLYSWMQQFNHLLVSDLGMPVNYLPFPLKLGNNSHWILQEVLEVVISDFTASTQPLNGGIDGERDCMVFSIW